MVWLKAIYSHAGIKNRPEPACRLRANKKLCPWFHLNSHLADAHSRPGNGGEPAGHFLPAASRGPSLRVPGELAPTALSLHSGVRGTVPCCGCKPHFSTDFPRCQAAFLKESLAKNVLRSFASAPAWRCLKSISGVRPPEPFPQGRILSARLGPDIQSGSPSSSFLLFLRFGFGSFVGWCPVGPLQGTFPLVVPMLLSPRRQVYLFF